MEHKPLSLTASLHFPFFSVKDPEHIKYMCMYILYIFIYCDIYCIIYRYYILYIYIKIDKMCMPFSPVNLFSVWFTCLIH